MEHNSQSLLLIQRPTATDTIIEPKEAMKLNKVIIGTLITKFVLALAHFQASDLRDS
jgi:hypothetical protein